MKKLRVSVAMLALLGVEILAGCSTTPTKAPDVSEGDESRTSTELLHRGCPQR